MARWASLAMCSPPGSQGWEWKTRPFVSHLQESYGIPIPLSGMGCLLAGLGITAWRRHWPHSIDTQELPQAQDELSPKIFSPVSSGPFSQGTSQLVFSESLSHRTIRYLSSGTGGPQAKARSWPEAVESLIPII